MKPTLMVSALVATGLFTLPALVQAADTPAKDLAACCTPGDKDFPTHNGNLGNQRYSSLTQIDQANINKLGPVWRTHVSAVAPATTHTGQQTSPLVVDGVIYLDTPSGGVIAVDGATGAAKWKWQPTAFGTSDTRRGVAVGDGKVYTLADGDRVVALDKNTGAEVWVVQPGFVVDPTRSNALGNIEKVATVYHDGMVYVGTNDGSRGAAFALKSSDGSLVWSFYGTGDHGTLTDVNGKTTDVAA